MSDPFVAEIRIFPFNFAPKNWAFCDGQTISISQNIALFSLLGTTYGGNGSSTFALPNMQGRAPMFPGQGPGLSSRDLGQSGGQESVTLNTNEMPSHTHTMTAATSAAVAEAPAGAALAESASLNISSKTGAQKTMASDAIASTGGSLPHNNMQPYLVMNFCIALMGIYPARP